MRNQPNADWPGNFIYTAKALADPETGRIIIETGYNTGHITRRMIETEDHAVREALIALGWTPPDHGHQPEQPEKKESI
ncbi:MAG: hypothetical protein ABID63_18180 [Pseudomonadota bacterium]